MEVIFICMNFTARYCLAFASQMSG